MTNILEQEVEKIRQVRQKIYEQCHQDPDLLIKFYLQKQEDGATKQSRSTQSVSGVREEPGSKPG